MNVQVIEGEVLAVAAYDPIEAQGEFAPLRVLTLRAAATRDRRGAFLSSSESVR
jgi:hypothetical protein